MSEDATLDEFIEKPESTERKSVRWGPKTESIPADWKFEPIIENSSEIIYPQRDKPTRFDGDIPWVRIEDLDGVYISQPQDDERFVSRDLMNEMNLRSFPEGTLMCSCSTTMGVCAITTREMLSNQTFAGIVTQDSINTEYLYYAISDCSEELEQIATGSTISYLSSDKLESFHVPVPPLSEQRKIATVLHTVDQAIEKAEEITEQVETLKSGVIQKIFREGTRDHDSYQNTKSGDVPDPWELSRFDEVITDTRYGTDTKSNTQSEGYPTLRIPNVVNKRITVNDLKHTPLNKDELERLKLQDDDILVIRTNGNPDYVGRCVTFHERDEPFVFASYLIRIRVDESRVRPSYVREFLNSPRGRSEMAGWVRSSAGNYNLSVGAMEKFQIPIPSLEEQDEMVEKITKVENTIEVNRDYRNGLQRLKRGLMQDLLSGTVRTTDTNIPVPEKITEHG